MKMEVHSGLREQLVRIILLAFLFWLESEYQEWAASRFYMVPTAASVCSAAFIHYDFFFFKKIINWEGFFLLFLLSDTMMTFSKISYTKTGTILINLSLHSRALYLPRQIYWHDRYSASIIELAQEAICPHGTLVIFFPE